MSTNGRYGLWTGLSVALVMLATLAVGVTYAQQQQQPQQPKQDRPGWQGGRMGMGLGPMGGPGWVGGLHLALRQLNLTDDQRQQIKTILSGHADDFKALADRSRPARQALIDAIAAGDEAAIRQHSGELAAVQTDGALLASRVHAEVFKILTPEQQQKAQALRKQAEQRMGTMGRRGPGRGGRGMF